MTVELLTTEIRDYDKSEYYKIVLDIFDLYFIMTASVIWIYLGFSSINLNKTTFTL